LWSFIRETSSYFSRGHAIFDEWTAHDNGAVADSITALAAKSKLVQRKMQDIHSLVPKMLGKLNLTARSTFYCFEGIPDPPAIKVYERITPPTAANSLAPMSKKLSNVSTASKKSTMSMVGGFSYLSGGSPDPHRPRSKSMSNEHSQMERSKSWKDILNADKPKRKPKLRRRPGVKFVTRKKESAQFYTTPETTIPIHLPESEMFQHFSGMPPDPDVMMEGYLYKRSSNAFKTWNRRWFQIKDNKLLYSHRTAESEEPTVMEENLMLCLVRPAPPSVDRVGCFELVTPTRQLAQVHQASRIVAVSRPRLAAFRIFLLQLCQTLPQHSSKYGGYRATNGALIVDRSNQNGSAST
ncbi:PH domain-containing protein, partial [Trichostrongylus colubriformis]